MKTNYFIILFLLIVFIALINSYFKDKYHEEQMQAIEELKIKVEERTHLDSLYWKHIENCSFIHKDSIGIGYQGYIYDKYNRKNNTTQN